MALELPSPPDVTHLPLREAAVAIRDVPEFTIGAVSVDFAELLAEGEGTTYRGLALGEAQALGGAIVDTFERAQRAERIAASFSFGYLRELAPPPQPERLVTGIEPKKPMAPGNVFLETVPLLQTDTDKTTGEPVQAHSWIFEIHTLRSRGDRAPVLLTVRFREGREDGSADAAEAYRRSMQGMARGRPITREELPPSAEGDPEDPNDLFYVAEMALLRAARTELRDR